MSENTKEDLPLFSFLALTTPRCVHVFCPHRQNRLRFVYTHFKSRDQSFDKSSFDFSNIFHAMQSCAMSAKSSIIAKLPMGMVIRLEMGKTNHSRLGLLGNGIDLNNSFILWRRPFNPPRRKHVLKRAENQRCGVNIFRKLACNFSTFFKVYQRD